MLVYLFCAFLILSLLLLPQLNSTLFPYTTLFRSAPRGTRLRLDQDLGHVRVPGPLLDLGGRTLRVLNGGADRSAPALVPIVVVVEPVVGLPIVERAGERLVGFGKPRRTPRRFQDRDVGTGLHDQLAKRHVGIAAGELAVGGERVDTHRGGVRVVGGVVVDRLADAVAQKILAAPGLRDVFEQLAATRYRVHVGVDDADGDPFGGRNPLVGVNGHRGLPYSGLPYRIGRCSDLASGTASRSEDRRGG